MQLQTLLPAMIKSRGYTLVELIVAIGLFALIMLLASGAYLMMIGLNRQAQGIATGINNLSFALETMTRNIRTGTAYNCAGLGDCLGGSSSFSFTNSDGVDMAYSLSASTIQETIGGNTRALTDPSVTITSLRFYVIGSGKPPGDYRQPQVTMTVTGTVSPGPGKPAKEFSIETGATMRGSDL